MIKLRTKIIEGIVCGDDDAVCDDARVAHALIKAIFESRIMPSEKRALHDRAAEILKSEFGVSE